MPGSDAEELSPKRSLTRSDGRDRQEEADGHQRGAQRVLAGLGPASTDDVVLRTERVQLDAVPVDPEALDHNVLDVHGCVAALVLPPELGAW